MGEEEHLPTHWNWRNKSILNFPVRRQRTCSCCWAMVAADLVTSTAIQIYNPANPRDFLVAPQELVDKMPEEYPQYLIGGEDENGCQASNIFWAFKYIKHFGIGMEEGYPYRGHRQFGTVIPKGPRIRLEEVVCLENATEIQIKGAIWRQLVGGKIEAYKSFRKLRGYTGIYWMHEKTPEEMEPDKRVPWHAITITGYGIDPESRTLFYHVRSSWGRKWGDQGFARVASDLIKVTWYVKSVEFVQ